jgi:hypothetical protein
MSEREVVEEVPNLQGAGAGEPEVVHIIILRAGGASSGVRELPKPSCIGRETTTLRKPTENLALQGSSTPPDRGRKIINLQMPESHGVEIFV